jgi:8-oxo-dGTP pyrophosphatase MutT (NUDIX family)
VKPLTLADLVDEEEVARLFAEYAPAERWQVTRQVSAQFFEEWWERLVLKGNRRGEAVLAIQRPDGQILLHTKPFYPEGVFRLPSGGIHPHEAVQAGMIRETQEETGLKVKTNRFLGMVEYNFQSNQRELPFVSYIWLVRTDNGHPSAQDPDERISGFRYVHRGELPGVAAQLRALPEAWQDWGQFRAPPHDLVAAALES